MIPRVWQWTWDLLGMGVQPSEIDGMDLGDLKYYHTAHELNAGEWRKIAAQNRMS